MISDQPRTEVRGLVLHIKLAILSGGPVFNIVPEYMNEENITGDPAIFRLFYNIKKEKHPPK